MDLVAEGLHPVVGPGLRVRVEQVLVAHLLPEVHESLGALVAGDIDGQVLAVDLVGVSAHGPHHRVEQTGVARVGGDVGAGGADLLRVLVELVPRGRCLADAGLVEHVLVVEVGHGTRVGGHRVQAAIDVHGVPGAGGERLLELVGVVAAEVPERAGVHELRDGEVFDQRDVRQSIAGLGGVVERGVGLVRAADVAHLHRDVGIGLHEGLGGAVDARVPGPDRQLGLAVACGGVAAGREWDEQCADDGSGYGCACGVVHIGLLSLSARLWAIIAIILFGRRT